MCVCLSQAGKIFTQNMLLIFGGVFLISSNGAVCITEFLSHICAKHFQSHATVGTSLLTFGSQFINQLQIMHYIVFYQKRTTSNFVFSVS